MSMNNGASKAILSVRNLHKTYPPEIQALNDFSLELQRGDFTAIIGPSGCGKTTLLRIAAGIETYQRGDVLFENQPIFGNTSWKRSVIYQDVRLFPWMTAKQNVVFALESKGFSRREAEEKAAKWMEVLEISGCGDVFPAELSAGLRQQVGVCRVLANEPDLIMCDEPFSSLDWTTRNFLQVELLKYWYETRKTVMFVTHNVEEAIYMSQKVVVMTARPGTIKEVVSIPLPEERWTVRRDSPALLEAAQYVADHIASEVEKAHRAELEVGY